LFRQTSIIKTIIESMAKLSQHDNVTVNMNSFIKDEAVWIDDEQIVTAFSDLEQNALDAMPNGGILTIIVEGDERQVAITMTDTGAGIAEENMPLLFTPFFTTKPIGEGIGLGLPQAYATIRAHSGNISIQSNANPGKGPTGTTVKIVIPRRLVLPDNQAKFILHEEK
jgi:signal transduction histidine kinase